MFCKTVKKELMRMIKKTNDEELVHFIYLLMLKKDNENLKDFQLFGTKNITF